MRTKFQRICPYGKKYLDKLVEECIRDILLLSTLSFVVVLLWNGFFEETPGLYLAESLFLAGYLVLTEVPNYKIMEREDKVYRELLIYFSRVKHKYLSCRHIAGAVLEAADEMSYEIQRLAGELHMVLMESDRKEKVREYILYHRTNRYVKLFLVQAYEASEKGDMMLSEGSSLFSENVEHLRLELMEELYRRKRQAHEFAGYTFVAMAPVFMMPLLKKWGLEFAPELRFFYAGTGKLLELVTVCSAIVIYGFINKAKDIAMFSETRNEKIWNIEWIYKHPMVMSVMERLEERKGSISTKIRRLLLESGENIAYGKLCLQMLTILNCSFLLLVGFHVGLHTKERRAVLEQVDTIETIAPVASDEKKKMLSEHILTVTEVCIKQKDVSKEQIRGLLREKIRLANETTETAAIEEITNKVEQYKDAKISFWEVILCLSGSLMFGALPLLKLSFQVQTAKAGAVHEVRQFQSVIIMERRLQGGTIVGLLEDMEVFSLGFRTVLRRCINTYGAGPKEALLRMKEEGSCLHESFAELADAFLSVDEVGIALAFEEVESNRYLLDKMTQLEAEINLERKKDTTELISKIPMALAVGAYFVLPFFLYALQGVYEIFDVLEGIRL